MCFYEELICFKTKPLYLAQAGLKLTILLLQPPKYLGLIGVSRHTQYG